jgi:hypothetical protein
LFVIDPQDCKSCDAVSRKTKVRALRSKVNFCLV